MAISEDFTNESAGYLFFNGLLLTSTWRTYVLEFNYHKEYNTFHDKCEYIHMKTIEDHIKHYEIIEELIGFQNWLNNQVADIYNADTEYARQNFSEASIHGLFTLNLLSLYSAFITIPQNLVHQTIANIRTVYESIPKMYYMSFFPDECGKVILCEYISGKKDEDAINILTSPRASKIYEIYNMTYSSELLNQLRDKYHFDWFLKKIYSADQISRMKSTYSLFNTSSHSAITRVGNLQPYSKEDTGDIFELVEILSFFNIASNVNGHRKMIEARKFPFIETARFMEKIRSKLAKDGNMYSLFPDNPEISNKLIISPPGSPWEQH